MEQEQEKKKGFGYWFTNVFLYHYWKLSILAVFLLGTAIWFTVDALKKEEYDLNVAIVADRGVSYLDLDPLKELLGEAAGDVNGDKKILVNISTVNLGDEDNLESSHYQMMLYLSLPEYTIFLINNAESALLARQDDTFQPLADYGIRTEDATGLRVWVGDKAPLPSACRDDCYACLSDWTVSGKGSKKMTDAAVRALKALLDSPAAEG